MHMAADEYLAACKEFEAAKEIEGTKATRSLLMAQTNGALALALSGRIEDALSLARGVIAALPQHQAIAPQLLPTLKAVLAEGERKKSK